MYFNSSRRSFYLLQHAIVTVAVLEGFLFTQGWRSSHSREFQRFLLLFR